MNCCLQRLHEHSPDQLLTATKALESANKVYSLYVTQNPAEQAKLLDMVRCSGVELDLLDSGAILCAQ